MATELEKGYRAEKERKLSVRRWPSADLVESAERVSVGEREKRAVDSLRCQQNASSSSAPAEQGGLRSLVVLSRHEGERKHRAVRYIAAPCS
jgi:hypothetical protein